MHQDHNEQYRYGSARWATDAEMHRAGMFSGKGLQIGFRGKKPVYIDGDAPLITLGGAGSGKLRDMLGYTMLASKGMRKLVLDPRGELAAISINNFVRYREHAFCLNPVGLHGLPMHRLNPLDILSPNSHTLHADAKFIAEGLIALSGSSGGQYFELRARGWLETLLISLTLSTGSVTFPKLMQAINAIEGDPVHWSGVAEGMLESPYLDIRRTGSEIMDKKHDSPREFGSIMGELYAHMSVFNDPLLMNALSEPDFSLAELCNADQVAHIFLNIPIEYIGIWSPLVRSIFTVASLYKMRRPAAARISYIVDEAGQLGRAEFLLRAFTFGRGAGIRAWAVFQDIGQIKRNFGHEALQGFMGSAQTRILFGVRDLETAEYVSRMLGDQTLEFDNPLQQSEAARQKKQIIRKVLGGASPFEAAYQYNHYRDAASNRTKQIRRLKTPSEILAMPEDREIVFVSGKNLDPLYLEKRPYYEDVALAGMFMPNPYHPPIDKVLVPTRYGKRWRRMITEPVPEKFAHYPQYCSGTWSYIEGYRPK
jgi:type IV secretion system protein VirD4